MPSVTREQWPLLSKYLDQALELGDAERGPWLEALERDQPALAERLRHVLALRDRSGFAGFLAGSAPSLAEAVSPLGAVVPLTLAGRRVGPYAIEEELGRGGMGSVWRARRVDGRYEGTVALKFVHAAWIGNAGAQRFKTEGSLLARLSHPNIARLIDAGVLDGTQPYLVIEYVDGEPIDVYCSRHRLGLEARITLFLSVLAAVAHAHSHLVVHRDLKPGNVFVTRDGTAKLLDFGIATLLDDRGAAPLTQSSASALTPQYAAPEQLLGKDITTATDVYALGLVLFLLLTGTHPVAAEPRSSAELIRAIIEDEPCRASAVGDVAGIGRRALAGDLDNILAKALRKDPLERYESAGAFAEDLRRFLDHQPVSAHADTVGYRAAKFIRRHRGGVAAAVLTALLLVAATIVTTVQTIEAKRQRDAAEFEARRAESATDFLNLLLQSDGGPGHPPLTTAQRLELGARMLESQYAGDPRFAGRMLVQLSRQFRGATDTRAAVALDARAYALGAGAHDPELMALAQCTAAYAEATAAVTDRPPARLAEATRLMATLRTVPLGLQVDCNQAQAVLASRLGDATAAEQVLQRTRRLLEDAGETRRAAYTSVLTDLGGIYNDTSRLPEALAMAELIGATHERFGRGGTTARLMALHNQAVVVARMGELRTSTSLLADVRRRDDLIQGEGVRPLSIDVNYADGLERLGRLGEAAQVAREAIVRARTAGNAQWLSAALRVACRAEIDGGQVVEAEATLREIASALPRNFATDRRLAGMPERLRARLQLLQGDAAGALQSATAALAAVPVPAGGQSGAAREAHDLASIAALQLGRTADAERHAREALRMAERVARGPDTSADVGEALLLLAKAQAAEGRSADARTTLEHAVRALTNGLGAEHLLTREAVTLLHAQA